MEGFVTLKKKKISYSDVGSGQAVVFLHGWMDSKVVFDNIVSILSKKYRCISIDLPGFGKSDLVNDVSLGKISRMIDAVINRLGIKKFSLVGHSFGGAVTLVYASRFEEKIIKIVLISPFITFKQFSKSVFYIITNLIPFLINKILKFKRPNMRVINAFKIAYLLSSVDLYKYLIKVRKDILFVYGRHDSLLSIRPLEPLFGVLNNIHLAIYENVRHYIFSYNPNDLAEKITLFFNNNKLK